MRNDLAGLNATVGGRSRQDMPFLVRHFAVCRPNRIAASMRIPVTPANRALLRELRAEEMAAWAKAGRRCSTVKREGLL